MSYEESEKDHSFKGRGSHRRHGYGNESGEYYLDDEDNDSEGTETPARNSDESLVDDVGAQDAFIAGMIYALTRRICPGLPYTPAWSGEEVDGSTPDTFRWRLDECLKFATELSGRKGRRKGWDWAGLADEMTQAGWFDP
jgi:sugar/nucleoside kinase (ribokinase family)